RKVLERSTPHSRDRPLWREQCIGSRPPSAGAGRSEANLLLALARADNARRPTGMQCIAPADPRLVGPAIALQVAYQNQGCGDSQRSAIVPRAALRRQADLGRHRAQLSETYEAELT